MPTGVELGEGSRVVLMPDGGGVAKALASRLAALGVEVLEIDGAPEAEALEATLADWAATGPIQGVYWLPALDDEGPLRGLEPAAWREALRVRVKLLAVTMRALAEHVGASGTFLVSATRLGGRHGYGVEGSTSVLGGAVTGFTKALARERAEALVKAVDLAPSRRTAALADLLVDETLHDPGAVEIGHADDLRWTVGLVEEPAGHDPALSPTADTIFMVTGAAGSIVSAITADLAASGGTFHLLDLVAEPDPGDPDLARFGTDRDALMGDLAERIRERGERPTPKLVERELAGIERARAALDAIEAIQAAGGTARWHQVDLTDTEQVSAAVAAALAQSGHVDVLIHAAGIEISHFLPDKPQREYDLVFDVKAEGWLNLLHALGETALERRDRLQLDRRALRQRRPDRLRRRQRPAVQERVEPAPDGRARAAIAIDWTAWAGIGMASRGSIPTMMEAAGIDMLPPEVGVPVVRRELTAPGARSEVVVAGELGVLLAEHHPTGGLDAERATASAAAHGGPMTGRIAALTVGGGLRVLTELDPGRQAFLDDHRIEGTPVLPGVMGMEGFAEAARALLPGWEVVALEDVELLAPFKFYRDEPRTLELRALIRDGGDGTLVADCELVGRRTLAGQAEQETRHFTGRALLAREAPAPPPAVTSPAGERRRRRPRRRLPRLLPRPGLPGARARVARRRPRRRPARRRASRRPRAA